MWEWILEWMIAYAAYYSSYLPLVGTLVGGSPTRPLSFRRGPARKKRGTRYFGTSEDLLYYRHCSRLELSTHMKHWQELLEEWCSKLKQRQDLGHVSGFTKQVE